MLECKKTLVEVAAESNNKLFGSYFSVTEFLRIYLKTNLSDYFFKDNLYNCDFGSNYKIHNL